MLQISLEKRVMFRDAALFCASFGSIFAAAAKCCGARQGSNERTRRRTFRAPQISKVAPIAVRYQPCALVIELAGFAEALLSPGNPHQSRVDARSHFSGVRRVSSIGELIGGV